MDKGNINFVVLWVLCFVCFGYWFTSAAEFSDQPTLTCSERYYQDPNNFELTIRER